MFNLVKSLLVAIAILIPAIPQSQCDSEAFLDKCASNLGSFTFVKSFNVNLDKSKDKQEFSYVFSKGSNYMLVVCDQNQQGGKMILNLYDRSHKFIASSYNKQSKKHYPSVTYPCSATGVYYIESTFENKSAGCGVSILGFEKK